MSLFLLHACWTSAALTENVLLFKQITYIATWCAGNNLDLATLSGVKENADCCIKAR